MSNYQEPDQNVGPAISRRPETDREVFLKMREMESMSQQLGVATYKSSTNQQQVYMEHTTGLARELRGKLSGLRQDLTIQPLPNIRGLLNRRAEKEWDALNAPKTSAARWESDPNYFLFANELDSRRLGPGGEICPDWKSSKSS
jgi:hypothetical protein